LKVVTNNKKGHVYIVLQDDLLDCTNARADSVVTMVEYMNLYGTRFVRDKDEFYKKFTVRSPEDIKYVGVPDENKDPDHW
jgi:hypothetical protein